MAANLPLIKAAPAAVRAVPALGQLSFTGRRPDDSGINLWCPAEIADDWAGQCRVGREYGREAVDYIRETGDAAAFGGIVRAIAERGTFGGVEAGFFAAVSVALAEAA